MVEISRATLHQAGAMTVFALAVWVVHRLGPESREYEGAGFRPARAP